jgi:hypothetical protein
LAEHLMPGRITSQENDPSRHADMVLKVTIAMLIFFYPGGYNIQMFGAFGICRLMI